SRPTSRTVPVISNAELTVPLIGIRHVRVQVVNVAANESSWMNSTKYRARRSPPQYVRVRPLDGTGPFRAAPTAAPPSQRERGSLRRYPADSPRTRQRRPGPFEQRRASARWRGGLAKEPAAG